MPAAVRPPPGATLVSLVPTALARLDPALVPRASCSGAPRRRPAVPPNAVTTYGLTETGSGVVYDGVPLDGVEVRIDDDGEVHLRGPMLLRAYRDGTRSEGRRRLVRHGRRRRVGATAGSSCTAAAAT